MWRDAFEAITYLVSHLRVPFRILRDFAMSLLVETRKTIVLTIVLTDTLFTKGSGPVVWLLEACRGQRACQAIGKGADAHVHGIIFTEPEA